MIKFEFECKGIIDIVLHDEVVAYQKEFIGSPSVEVVDLFILSNYLLGVHYEIRL